MHIVNNHIFFGRIARATTKTDRNDPILARRHFKTININQHQQQHNEEEEENDDKVKKKNEEKYTTACIRQHTKLISAAAVT